MVRHVQAAQNMARNLESGWPPSKRNSIQIKTGDYGLRGEALSPMETLAQSVSTIAPTSTPAATIPLVAALAGNGTWLAYLLAMIAILLVAWCISRFARYSASPGSLYTYAADDSSTLARRGCRLEPPACLRCHGFQRHRRLLSIC